MEQTVPVQWYISKTILCDMVHDYVTITPHTSEDTFHAI